MPVTASDILKNVSEGNLNTSDGTLSENAESPFIRMIILDVISDPKIILSDKDTKSKLVSFNIKNIELISTLPRNTIVAKK